MKLTDRTSVRPRSLCGFRTCRKILRLPLLVVWENGRHGGSAAQLARPVFDYWLMQRKKNPIKPEGHQISGGLMTAGIKNR